MPYSIQVLLILAVAWSEVGSYVHAEPTMWLTVGGENVTGDVTTKENNGDIICGSLSNPACQLELTVGDDTGDCQCSEADDQFTCLCTSPVPKKTSEVQCECVYEGKVYHPEGAEEGINVTIKGGVNAGGIAGALVSVMAGVGVVVGAAIYTIKRKGRGKCSKCSKGNVQSDKGNVPSDKGNVHPA